MADNLVVVAEISARWCEAEATARQVALGDCNVALRGEVTLRGGEVALRCGEVVLRNKR